MRRTQESQKVLNWREKAKSYRLEKERLHRRVKELTHSRDLWKGKYKMKQAELAATNRSDKIARRTRSERAQRHHYPVFVMGLCIWFRQQGNCSFRTCSKIISELLLYLNLEVGSPCASTIQNWEQKMGYYQLHQPYDCSDSWAIIVDESISIGQAKLLLILGVRLSSYRFDRPLSHADVDVLQMAVARSWTGDGIAEQLSLVEQRGCPIAYGISDEGNNISKAFKIKEIPRISDCTHAISKAVEKCYKDQEEFVNFSRAAVKFKQKVVLSCFAFLMPPTQRSKARFLNLHSLSQWAEKSWKIYQQSKKDTEMAPIEQKLQWIEPYQDLIEQLAKVCKTMRKLFAILKTQGLNDNTAQACRKILDKSHTPEKFTKHIRTYLDNNLTKFPANKKLIVCSDVIESIFGKFKNRQAHNPYLGITAGCLSIPNFGKKFPQKEVKNAMESTTITQIQQWKNENIINPMKNQFSLLCQNIQ